MSATIETTAPTVPVRAAGGLWDLRPYVIMAVSVAVLSVAVALFAGGFWLSTLTSTLAVSIAAMGVGLLYGRLGLVSLCQYALVGIGGWAALRVHFAFDPPFVVSVLVGGIAAMVVGVVWGLPALRLRGLYLALVTLMLAGAFQIAIVAVGFPDGGEGFLGRVAGTGRVMMERPGYALSDPAYFLFAAVAFALSAALVIAHIRSKAGRSWALIRKDERMAAAAGVRVVRYKLWSFALSGFLAGIAGGLLAGAVGQLDGRSFGASESIMLFVLSVVAGAWGWAGALLAGGLLRAVPSLLSDWGIEGYAAMILFGIAVIHAFSTASEGLAVQIGRIVRRLWSRISKGSH